MHICETWVLGETRTTYCHSEEQAKIAGCNAILMWIDEDVADEGMTAEQALDILSLIRTGCYNAAITTYVELLKGDVRIDINHSSLEHQVLEDTTELQAYLEEVRDGGGI